MDIDTQNCRACWSHKFESDAELIDGKATAATIRKETAAEVAALKEKTGKACDLGTAPAWQVMPRIYDRHKTFGTRRHQS